MSGTQQQKQTYITSVFVMYLHKFPQSMLTLTLVKTYLQKSLL